MFVLIIRCCVVVCSCVCGILSPLGGVVFSVLATRPKEGGFKPGQGDGFLRAIKIRSTTSSDGK
jgi:hypothetical protein